MPVGNTDNVFRSIAALIRQSFATGLEGFLNGASGLPVANGGTGATSAATARTNLGLGAAATADTVPVANGGTGGTTAATARTNLAAVGISAVSLTATGGYVRFSHSLLPSGFTVQWGSFTPVGDSYQTITYPVAFASFSRAVVSCAAEPGNNDGQQNGPGVTACGTANFTTYTSANTFSTAFWIAVGV